MKSGTKRFAEGGRTEPKEPKAKEDERTKEMVAEEKEGHKRGGEVKGEKARMHLGKKARGGRMTPKSPFSGADVKKAPYESTLGGHDEGGRKALP
jgi:hypothetical protein